MITVEHRNVQRRGTCCIGWYLGHGYVREDRIITSLKWCVMEDGKLLAECRSKAIAERFRAALEAME